MTDLQTSGGKIPGVMTNSRYEYVKTFEHQSILTPQTWLVVRLDGHAFHSFTHAHGFVKPNDERNQRLMNHAARAVMREFPDVVLAYGCSDEFSFLFRRGSTVYNRREEKLLSTVVSVFTGHYVHAWPLFFSTAAVPAHAESSEPILGSGTETDVKMQYVPSFDGRIVVYPNEIVVRDYFSWRQVDCHINNLYNTTFWALVQRDPKGPRIALPSDTIGPFEGRRYTNQEAEERLKGTFSNDKNEILWREFGINYNTEPEMFKKGSILLYTNTDEELEEYAQLLADSGAGSLSKRDNEKLTKSLKKGDEGLERRRRKRGLQEVYVDLIADEFWNRHPHLLKD